MRQHQDMKTKAFSAIHESYKVLNTAENLSPLNEIVTAHLRNLVDTLACCCAQQEEVQEFLLTSPELSTERDRLPELCGRAECEMEKYWARRLAAQSPCRLEDFWYYEQYAALVRAEKALFEDREYQRISFLGSGALPLTAILLARETEAEIICVDLDAGACALSRDLLRAAGLEKRVEVRCMNALDYVPGDNELVICASLLRGREEVYRRLQEAPGCALLVRDAEGVFQFLYKAAELPRSGFREVRKTAANSGHINTTRYYERDIQAAA